MEETRGTRINRARVQEALNTGAGVLAAACPYCMTMFEDGILGMDASEQLQVRDIAELVAAAMVTPTGQTTGTAEDAKKGEGEDLGL
jgi:Fe-S oxidoreductase